MKRLILILITLLILTFVLAIPAQGAPPDEEEWQFGGARNGLIRATYYINTTNLFTNQFNFYNDTTDIYAIPYVMYNGEEVWRYVLAPQSEYHVDYKVKFRRLPATDPDDPDSIRYPEGYSFGMWTGSDPNNYPAPQ